MKHFIAGGLVALGASTAAWAQSSVTLYGSLDAGVAYVSNVGGHSKWMAEQGNTQPDRWGLRGVEDLGGGLHALFQLENGFSTVTGAFASPGTLFNRQAYVGLGDDRFGTLTLGRQTPFAFDILDPFSTAYLAQSWFAFHPGNLDELADTGVVPFNNAVKFRSANYGGFTVGAMLGLGNTTNFSTGRNMGFAVTYEHGPLRVGATWANEHDRSPSLVTTGIAQFQGMPAASYLADKVEHMGAGLSYRIGKLLLHGVYTRVKFESAGGQDTWQSFDAGANYRLTPVQTLGGGAATTTLSGRRWTQFEIGDTWSLSKRTQVYVNALYERASSNAAAAFFTAGVSGGRNQTIFVTGVHHSF